jgi:plastocyanin
MRWYRKTAAALVGGGALTIAALAFVAPAGAGGGGHCMGFERSTTISMADACFQGAAHFVPSGARVTVSNDGEMVHDIQAVDASFSSGELPPGATFEFDAPVSGVMRFYCTLHGSPQGGGMTGVLIVGDGAQDAGGVAAVTGTSVEETGLVAQTSGSSDAALVIASVALVVALLATAGVGGVVLSRYMRSERA